MIIWAHERGAKMISEKIKALESLENKRGMDMAEALEITPSNYSRKKTQDQWTAQNLIKIARALGWRIAFIKGDERIYIDD